MARSLCPEPWFGSVLSLLQEKACRKELSTPQPTTRAGSPEEHPKHSLPVPKLRPSAELAQSAAPSLSPSASAPASDTPASDYSSSDTVGSSLPRAARSTAPSTPSLCPQAKGVPPGCCDTCAAAQAGLHQVGSAIADLCQSQNIPSALAKFQEAVERARGTRSLSATDMSSWATEQSRDLSRINKHLQLLLQQLDPLKAELKELKKQRDKLQGQVEDFPWLLQAERESQARQRKEAEQRLELKSKEHGEAVARLEQDKDRLQRGTTLLPAPPPRQEHGVHGQSSVPPPRAGLLPLVWVGAGSFSLLRDSAQAEGAACPCPLPAEAPPLHEERSDVPVHLMIPVLF